MDDRQALQTRHRDQLDSLERDLALVAMAMEQVDAGDLDSAELTVATLTNGSPTGPPAISD